MNQLHDSYNGINIHQMCVQELNSNLPNNESNGKSSSDSPTLSPRRRIPLPSRAESKQHAIFGSLFGPNCIRSYVAYELLASENEIDRAVIESHVTLGSHLDGHNGVIHGGILALLVDDTLGLAYSVVDPNIVIAMTANLSLNYRAPVPSEATISIRVTLKKKTERKLIFGVSIIDSIETSKIYVEGSSVYVIPRSATVIEQSITNPTSFENTAFSAL